jgi:single-strand DNA-binding protein
MGRIGRDAILEYTSQNQTPMIKFSLATSERRGDATETHWHDCLVFGKSAEKSASLLKKGTEVFVVGKLWCRSYQDKNGNPRRSVEILVGVLRAAQSLGQKEEEAEPWE